MASTSSQPEPETKDDFQSKMQQTVLSGFKLVGLALGIKLDLFKAFEDISGPLLSEELAAKANCKERYVREWLHHMVMCDIVDVDESGKQFSLPDHRRTVLMDTAQLINVMGPAFPALLSPHKDILSCFREDGPIGLSFDTVLPFFDERTLKNAPSLEFCANHLRDNVPHLKDKLESGIKVLEIGTGNGVLLLHLASQFPKSTFVGIDLSEPLLNKAKQKRTEAKLDSSVDLLLQDATELPANWTESFDLVVIRDVLHDISHASAALRSVHRCLKSGGTLCVFEVNLSQNIHTSLQNPLQKTIGQMAYIISSYHCLPASMVVAGSEALGAGSGIETITRMIEGAGFTVAADAQPADMFNKFLICTKP